MTEIWTPDNNEMQMGQDGYVRYAAGLILLHHPDKHLAINRDKPLSPEEQNEIVLQAQTFMWFGLTDVIRYANAPENRNKEARLHYKEAIGNMRAMVSGLVEYQHSRLADLHPLLPKIRPLAVRHEPVYKNIAHGNKDKVRIKGVMDTFIVSSVFDTDVKNKDFTSVDLVRKPAWRKGQNQSSE